MTSEMRIAYLRPAGILSRLSEFSAVYVPMGPLEWHAPHLPFGVDAFNAETVATEACGRTGGLVWPTLFWGTERERGPDQVEGLGFARGDYLVGMDFPDNSLPSAYCPEEIFAMLVREVLREVAAMGARLAVIVNGHGAVNHNQVLQRLATEFNHTGALALHVRLAMPQAMIDSGSLAHAAAVETSLMLRAHPETVQLDALPPSPEPLKYTHFAIVDSPGFDGTGTGEVADDEDPRTASSAADGEEVFEQTVSELARDVGRLMAELA